MLGNDPSVQHPPIWRGGHPCSFSKDLSISCHISRASTAWEPNRIQVQLSAQENGWMPCINIAAVNLTVKAECELSWTWFKQDIEVNSMEMLASCKPLAENGIMMSLTADPAQQGRLKQRTCFWWYGNLGGNIYTHCHVHSGLKNQINNQISKITSIQTLGSDPFRPSASPFWTATCQGKNSIQWDQLCYFSLKSADGAHACR